MKDLQFIAQRELLYSLKGEDKRRNFAIRISAPYLVDREKSTYPVDEGAAACTIDFSALNEMSVVVHGIDLIHALAQAVDIDPYLKAFTKKYYFYWTTGENYFDD